MEKEILEKIDLGRIRGEWLEYGDMERGNKIIAGGNDTIKSIEKVAEKVNEIIDLLTKRNK